MVWATSTVILIASIFSRPSSAIEGNAFSPNEILNKGIEAVGGAEALRAIQGLSYHSYLYRTQSLEESQGPGHPDASVASSGSETISYDFSGNLSDVAQRIDKTYTLGNFWNFARPNLDPVDVSLVVRGGTSGYACYVKGNEHIFNDPSSTFGYTDGFLADVLVRDALRLSPKLLLQMQANTHSLSAESIIYHETGPFPAVTDHSLNITVIFDPETFLPYLVRSYEDHLIFGNSTNDYVLTNYTETSGMMFPRLVQIMYNENSLLLHSLRDTITINATFTDDFFSGLPLSLINETYSLSPPSAPVSSTEYGAAEVFENNANLVWYGPYQSTLATLNVTQPVPELPNLYHLVFEGSIYTCTVGVFDNAVMVTDAAPHQSKLVIEWVEENLHRNVTHLLVTHHHHDHNYGAADFVAAGATLVVPEDYVYYWQNIPGVKFHIVKEGQPFKHKDSKMQVRAIWHQNFVHADDWMYFVWTEACPGKDSPMVATIADAWSPGFIGYEFDHLLASQYLDLARQDHMPHDYLVVPIHGTPHNVTDLYDLLGYAYPNYSTTDLIPGGPLCSLH